MALWCVWDVTIDDAYITFRYSRHLAQGFGPVWNLGEPSVQGYTGLLWMLLLAPAAALGVPLELAAKLLGVASTLGVALQLWRAAREWGAEGCLARWPVCAWLLFPPTWIHAVAGLETQAYALVALRLAVVTARGGSPASACVWALLAGLTRPEGFAVGGAALAWLFWKSPPLRRRLIGWGAGLFVAPALALGVWQAWFYGALLPNPFFVKVGDLAQGWLWWKASSPVLLPALLLITQIRAEAPGGVRGSRLGPASLLALMLAVGVAPYCASRLLMDYAVRFLAHVLPLCLWGATLGWLGIGRRWGGGPAVPRAALAGLLVYGVLSVEPLDLLYGRSLESVHVAVGRALRGSGVPERFRTLALADAGAIPYFSDWSCLDLVGLNDRWIARGMDPALRIEALRPSVVFLYTVDGRPGPVQFGVSVLKLHGYRFLRTIPWGGRAGLTAYGASQLPREVSEEIERVLREVRGNAWPLTWTSWLRHLEERLLRRRSDQ